MKTLLCLLMAVMCLANGFRVRAEAIPEENILRLLTVVLNAAKLKDETVLAMGEDPSQGLQEAAFALDAFLGGEGDRVIRSLPELEQLYRNYFAAGAYTLPAEGDCPCVTVEGDTLVFDLEELYETPLIRVEMNGTEWTGREELLVTGLLYWAWPASPEETEMQQDAVLWGSFEARLLPASDTRLGFVLAAFRLQEAEEGS